MYNFSVMDHVDVSFLLYFLQTWNITIWKGSFLNSSSIFKITSRATSYVGLHSHRKDFQSSLID